MRAELVAPFCAASEFFADVVAAVPSDRYGERWSDEWTILELIAHGNRANVLPVEYHEHPVPVAGPDYVLPEHIAERARQAVVDLGDDPVVAVRAASERVIAMVTAAPDDAMVGTPFGERALAGYLRSRIAELVLHGLDLAPMAQPPSEALVECGSFLVERAVERGHGVELVQALTGRGSIPQGFTVY